MALELMDILNYHLNFLFFLLNCDYIGPMFFSDLYIAYLLLVIDKKKIDREHLLFLFGKL